MNKHGGKRRNAGRKPGAKNKLQKEMRRKAETIDAGVLPVDFLLSVMRDAAVDLGYRLEAAKGAAPYIHKRQPQDVNQTHSFPTPVPVVFTHTLPPDVPDDATAPI